MPRPLALLLASLALPCLVSAAEPAAWGGATIERGGRTIRVPPATEPSADEVRVFSALAQGDESFDTLVRALVYASGVNEPAAVEQAEALARKGLGQVAPAVRAQTTAAAKGKALLEAMHRELFVKYAFDQTYPVQALETGVYNCVSSAVLYNAYAAALGLKAIGAVAPSHAYSYLLEGGRRHDVQTTTARGFDLHMSAEEHRAFLRKLGLQHTDGPSGPVSNAKLVAVAIENRLSMAHDGAASESVVRAQLALVKRLVLLVPSDASYRKNLVASWQKLASVLREKGRLQEAFAATRGAVEAAVQSADRALVASARNNVPAYAQLWMKEVAPAAPGRALGVLDEARELLGCAGKQECRVLELSARGLLFDLAKAKSDAHDDAGAWAVAELVATRLPAAENAGNLVFFALREAERRWSAAGPTEAERFVGEQLGRLQCGPQGPRDCTVLAGWMTGRLFETDTQKALAWARRTHAIDPASEGARQNLAAALHNEIVRLVDARDCGKVSPLATELARTGIPDPDAQRVARSCR